MGVLVWLILLLVPVLLFYISNRSERKAAMLIRAKVQQELTAEKRAEQFRQANLKQATLTNETRVAVLSETNKEKNQVSAETKKIAPSKLVQPIELETEETKPLDQIVPPTRLIHYQRRLAEHKTATEEYYNGNNCPAFDYTKFATDALTTRDKFMGMMVRSQVVKNKWTSETRFYDRSPRELKPIGFKMDNAWHSMSKEKLQSLITDSQRQLALLEPYEALKLLLPYHIMQYFKPRPPTRYWDVMGRLQISDMVSDPSGPEWIMSLDGAYSRSYLARLIVFQGWDWGEIIQVAELMLRNGMIRMPAEYLQKELEALRWCAKYWYRALAFGEPINFDYDTAKWSPYKWSSNKNRKSVSDFYVPPLLQVWFSDYNILEVHRKKPRHSINPALLMPRKRTNT